MLFYLPIAMTIVANASAAILSIPIAYHFFDETIRPGQYAGMALALCGLILMARR